MGSQSSLLPIRVTFRTQGLSALRLALRARHIRRRAARRGAMLDLTAPPSPLLGDDRAALGY